MAEPRQGCGMGQTGNPQHFGVGRGRLAPNAFADHGKATVESQSLLASFHALSLCVILPLSLSLSLLST